VAERRASFRRFAIATIAAVYFLIFVGGLVRASGSGMGCPDWPKCFGRWIPPTSESQLPADYQERWAEHGYGEARFNVWKTWMEYGNRMIGVVIGFLIFVTLILAFRRFRREDPTLVWWCAAALLLVGFNGWLGSVVVSTNLEPWIITAHMLAALAVVAALLLALEREARPELAALDIVASRGSAWLFAAALALSLVQLVMGTQVREEVDHLVNDSVVTDRGDWAGELGPLVLVHRSFSIAVLAVTLWLARRLAREAARAALLRRLAWWIVAVIAVEIAAGAGLFYLGFPPALQPVHLLLASVLLGLQFLTVIVWRHATRSRRILTGTVSAARLAAP
jgi:cytochrome c oxidase assembly protein subunit 15